MSISLDHFSGSDVIFARCADSVTVEQVLANTAMLASTEFRSSQKVVVDAISVREVDLSVREFRDCVGFMKATIRERGLPLDLYIAARGTITSNFIRLYALFAPQDRPVKVSAYGTVAAAIEAANVDTQNLTGSVQMHLY